MKTHETAKHPGPWQFMRVDSEFTGVLIAVGFLLMAFVSMPLAAWFVGCNSYWRFGCPLIRRD